MKVRRVRFAGITPIPSVGRGDTYTEEVLAGDRVAIEAKSVDGIQVLEIRVAGKNLTYVPIFNVKSWDVEQKIPEAKPAEAAQAKGAVKQ